MKQHPLKKAMVHIVRHPESWDQGTWICGTVACLAGRIVLQAGARPRSSTADGTERSIVTYRGEPRTTYSLACELAGLTDAEAQHLFDAYNTRDDLCQDTVRLVNDHAMNREPETWMHTHHHCWTDGDGGVVVTAHRRTSFVLNGSTYEIIDHPTRAGAKDYAGDVATCRGLVYTWNEEPPEVPK